MRLLAEEQKIGTLELLLTSPVREFEIVVGKFLAAFITVSGDARVVALLCHPAIRIRHPGCRTDIDWLLGLGSIRCCYAGDRIVRFALSPNQIVGLVVGAGLLTGLTIIDFVSERVTGVASEVLDALQLGHRSQSSILTVLE